MRPSYFSLRPALALLTLLVATTTACTKEIDLDLSETAPQVVIEATLADDGTPCHVGLRQTVNYDAANAFPAVSGATLLLRDETTNESELLTEAAPGKYVGQRLLGQVGHRYRLDVTVAGRTYAATSTLPAPVPLTGLRVETSSFGPTEQLVVVPEYVDPAGSKQYYYFRQTLNGVLQPELFVYDDALTDGRPNFRPLQANGPADDEIDPGDSVRVELHNVDSVGYEYFRTLNQLRDSNPLFTATPANPASNFSGGALGYFSACARQVRAVRVPQ